jgi:hypothetical protein
MTNESEVNPWAAIIGPCYTAASPSRSLGRDEPVGRSRRVNVIGRISESDGLHVEEVIALVSAS